MSVTIFVLRWISLCRVAGVIFLAALPSISSGSGLKTHIWIGQLILSEVQTTCRVRIQTISVSINPLVCQSIRNHPQAFLSGVLGPDVFPDLITGQVTTHPGIEADWQTSDWLTHMYATANPGPELAFAAGYVVHAASDIFAHSYVNAYSGDIFILSDERAVERRHFVLEKYIDSKLPNFQYNADMLQPPAEFLRDKLIHNPNAARLSRKSGVAMHVASMYDVYREVRDLARKLDDLETDAGKLIADVVVSISDANAKILTGESQLKLLREGLSANEAQLKAQQDLFDTANRELQNAIKALQDNKSQIDILGSQARAARDSAESARLIGKAAITSIASLQGQIANLQTQILNTQSTVASQVCNQVCNHCPRWVPGCSIVCQTVCTPINVVNNVYTGLTTQLNTAQQDLVNAQSRALQAGVDEATHAAIEATKIQEQASAMVLTTALETAKASVQATYNIQKARLDLQLGATREARNKTDELAAGIARLRKQVVDFESVKATLAEIIARSDVLSGYAKNWIYGMDVAGKEFILASHRISQGLIQGQPNFASSYLQWWKCYGNAYTAVPVQLGQVTCAAQDFLGKMENEVDKITERTLPPPFNEIFRRYLRLKSDLRSGVKSAVADAAVQFAKLVAPDPTTGDFIELLAKPENASRDKLNSVFATAGDAAGKPLLLFSSIADTIDNDLNLVKGALDPERFLALKNAVTLSKLALMDTAAIRGLVWAVGGDASLITTPAGGNRTSILFDMVRSIDGNHQWQPFGLPYPRASGEAQPVDGQKRRYGFGPGQERSGFELFINPNLRKSVFLKIFNGPISGGLQKHPNVEGKYPFPECDANPFPVGFQAQDGTPALNDFGCKNSMVPSQTESLSDFWRRALNQLRLNPYDPF